MAVFLLVLGLLLLNGIQAAKTNGQTGVLGGPETLESPTLATSLGLLGSNNETAVSAESQTGQSDYFASMGAIGPSIEEDLSSGGSEFTLSEANPILDDGYFVSPAQGFNFGKIHNNNAVDIANSCGTIVVASADGLVIPDKNYPDGKNGWNGGYGGFVLLDHPSGVKTRYAHLEKVLVDAGDFVRQGQKLGLMGSTGNVHGVTGCHLHFEVLGAKNPFAR